MSVKARNIYAAVLLGVGLMQMTGYLLGLRPLRGLGACTAASPFPKVFSDVDGLETFACDFTMVYVLPDGTAVSDRITPEVYQRLRGPYNRRNVYGAALSYGPRLPREIWETVFCYGLRPGGPFRREFGIPEHATGVGVLIEDKTRGRGQSWTLEPSCTP